MSESTRVQRWRQQQRAAGKDALTIWLPRELKLYLEDIALKRHCSPSDVIQQALTTCYPLSADVTDTVTDTIVTDTLQIRMVLQQELRALLYEHQHHQGVQAPEGVTDTDTVPVLSQLRTVVEEAVRESMDKWQQYQHLPVVPIVTDTDTDTVTDTATDTTTKATTAPELLPVADTVTDTQHALEIAGESRPPVPTPSVPDTVPVTDQTLEPFDTTRYRLGKLCLRSHDYHGTGQSLRTNNKAGYCLACNAEDARARRQAKRQEVSA